MKRLFLFGMTVPIPVGHQIEVSRVSKRVESLLASATLERWVVRDLDTGILHTNDELLAGMGERIAPPFQVAERVRGSVVECSVLHAIRSGTTLVIDEAPPTGAETQPTHQVQR